jgi:hypothetical protein
MEVGDRVVGVCRRSFADQRGRCWLERCNDGRRLVGETAETREGALRLEHQGRGKVAGSGHESGMWDGCVDRRYRTVDTVSVQDGVGLGRRQCICQGSGWGERAQEVTRSRAECADRWMVADGAQIEREGRVRRLREASRSSAECVERWRVADGAVRAQRGRVRRQREVAWEERQGRERTFQE